MILKKLFDRIHPHHHHHHQHHNNNHHHYDSQNLELGSQTSSLISLENEPLTPLLHSHHETNSLLNSNYLPNRISSFPNFTDDSDQTPTPRRPSIGNETRTISSDCLHASKKNKQSSSSIYNEAENENCPHFCASSNSSQSDCAKVKKIPQFDLQVQI